jgi:iron complex outermembrane recepter protein
LHGGLKLVQGGPVGTFNAIKAELYSVAVDHLMDNCNLRPLSVMLEI